MVKMVDVFNEIIDEDEEETEDRTADNESPSTNQHLELLPLENFKSPVWNHFGFPAKDGRLILHLNVNLLSGGRSTNLNFLI